MLAAFVAFVLFVPSAFPQASQFHCRWNFADFTVTGIGVKQVRIQTIAPYGTIYTNIITGDLRTFQAGTSGSLTVSNLANGRSYRVTFVGPNVLTVITNSFGTNVTGLVNAVDYLSAPIVVDGSTVGYSMTAADARFHNVSGDTSTNATFRGTLTFPDGTVSNYVWTATNASGAGAWRAVSATDANAIHNNVGGEIAAITDKATPVAADHLLIEDSAASDAKKDVTIGSLESALESVLDLQDQQGAVVDSQVPNNITIDLATLASTVTVADGTDATSFVAIFDSATGSLPVKTDGALTYDASAGALSATSFIGNGAGLTSLPSQIPITNGIVAYGDQYRTNAIHHTTAGSTFSNAQGNLTITFGPVTKIVMLNSNGVGSSTITVQDGVLTVTSP